MQKTGSFLESKKKILIPGSILVVAVLLLSGIYFWLRADVSGGYSKYIKQRKHYASVLKEQDGNYRILYSSKWHDSDDMVSYMNEEFIISEPVTLGKTVTGEYVLQGRDTEEDKYTIEVVFKRNSLSIRGLEEKELVLDKVKVK